MTKPAQPRRRLTPCAVVSSLLAAAAVLAYGLSWFFFTGWRHDLLLATACKDGYSGSASCLATTGWWEWVAAATEAVPFTATAMLALLGIIYMTLGKRLDLKDSYGVRGTALFYLAAWTGIIGGGMLMLLGISYYFVI